MSDEAEQGNESTAGCEGIAARGESAHAERRWPAVIAFVTAWLLPATTARRTQHVRLPFAYGVHLLTVLLTPVLIVALVAWDAVAARYSGGRNWFNEFKHVIGEIGEGITRYPAEAGLLIASALLTVEAVFLGLGVALMPWGADDERVRASFTNSLRQAWLHTTHALPLVFLFGVLMLVISAADRRAPFDTALPPYPTPTTAPVNSPAWKQNQAETRKWQAQQQAAYEAWNQRRAWYARNQHQLAQCACFAGLTWFLWAAFRAVGTRRRVQPVVRPPMCEACGYNLTAAPMDGRCPECGRSVAESLGPHVRPGTPWQRRRDVGFFRAWRRCFIDPIVRPMEFGRQVRLDAQGADHRWFLLMHLVLVFIVAPGGVIGTYVLLERHNQYIRAADYVWMNGPLAGWLAAAVAAFVALLAAAVVGIYYRITDKRNLMAGTVQIAAYLGGYLVLWTIISTAAIVGIVADPELFQVLEALLGIHGGALQMITWLLLNLVAALLYLRLVFHGSAGLRYANH